MLKQCLTGHSFDEEGLYKKGVCSGDDLPQQKNGQLMGSPISFPILCIINAAITRHVMETAYRTYLPFSMKPLQVNGDDIAFPLPPGAYDFWCRCVRMAGLVPSVGKNFFSREYLVINSQIFRYPLDWDRGSKALPERVPVINLGLIRGPSKAHSHQTLSEWIKGGDDPWSPYTLRANMEEAVRDWTEDAVRHRIISDCIKYARPVLDRLPPVSWFASAEHGGLGLLSTKEHVVSLHHRRLAAWMSCADEESKRASMKHHWIRSSGPEYAMIALDTYNTICDDVGARWRFREKKSSDNQDPLLSKLLWPSLPNGVLPPERSEDRDFLKEWNKSYWKWVRLANISANYLKPMGEEKVLLDSGCRWFREFRVV